VRGVERLAQLFELEVMATWPANKPSFDWTGDPEKLPHLDSIVGSAVTVVLELHRKGGGDGGSITREISSKRVRMIQNHAGGTTAHTCRSSRASR